MIMPRHAPPGAYVDDPAEKLDRPASEQPSVFTLASHGMTRIKEWAARGKAKQRALRHDLVTLSLCPEMLPCKHPSAAWCAREHGVSRQWASRLQQEFAREFGDNHTGQSPAARRAKHKVNPEFRQLLGRCDDARVPKTGIAHTGPSWSHGQRRVCPAG